MKTVYVLGAGFSKEAGLPLANEFFSAMLDVLGSAWNLSPSILSPLNETLRFHNEITKNILTSPIGVDDIEYVFSLIAADSLGRNHHKLKRFEMQIAIAYTLAIKTRDIYDCDPKIASDYARWLSIMLGDVINDDLGNTSIITLNYDDIVERSCQRNKMSYNHGFVSESNPYSLRRDNPSFVENINLVSGFDTNSLPIYKLHGSVRWLRVKSGDNQPGLMIGNPLSHLTGDELTFEPARYEILIEPPVFGKSLSDPYLALQWARAHDALRNAHRIVIIGYSFPKTDQHMLFLLISALRNNRVGKSCIIVNPEAEKSPEINGIAGRLYDLHIFSELETLPISAREFFEDPAYQGMR